MSFDIFLIFIFFNFIFFIVTISHDVIRFAYCRKLNYKIFCVKTTIRVAYIFFMFVLVAAALLLSLLFLCTYPYFTIEEKEAFQYAKNPNRNLQDITEIFQLHRNELELN